jgi:protein dithiol oxidoreductase (disulfide-forming)
MQRALAALFACAITLSLWSAVPASAQIPASQKPIRAGIDYRLIAPQPVQSANSIEVIDFFWYGCPYCNNLQPALERWISRKPADVTVRRIPAVLRDSWAPHARVFYTLEALGEVDRLHQRAYSGYHIEKLAMSRAEAMSEWAVSNGIARERWDTTYNSAAVQRKVEEAIELTRAYNVTGTPALLVDGRYLTSGNLSETLDGMIQILEGLIHRVRATR